MSTSSQGADFSQVKKYVIANHARKCWQAFDDSKSILPGDILGSERSKLASLDFKSDFEQFRVWTKNLGVFAPDTSSVDYRLRDAENVRESICGLLDALCENILQCEPAGF